MSLLGLSRASVPEMRPFTLAQSESQLKAGASQISGSTITYNVLVIDATSETEILDFWTNSGSTVAAQCLDIFTRIVENLKIIHETIEATDTLIEEYNTICNEKCLNGFINCDGVCKTNEECCLDNTLVACDTNNHDYPATPVANSPEAVCYNWCCEEDEYHCQGQCISENIPVDGGEITFGTEPNGDGTFPKECCFGDDCCTAPATWNMNTFPPQCCE